MSAPKPVSHEEFKAMSPEEKARYYNGYRSQDEFHEAMAAGFADYIERRARVIAEHGPEAVRHEGCSHADGICSG